MEAEHRTDESRQRDFPAEHKLREESIQRQKAEEELIRRSQSAFSLQVASNENSDWVECRKQERVAILAATKILLGIQHLAHNSLGLDLESKLESTG